jgi:hypothetical protein
VFGVRHDNVEFAVAVDVRHYHRLRGGARREGLRVAKLGVKLSPHPLSTNIWSYPADCWCCRQPSPELSLGLSPAGITTAQVATV